MTISDNTVVQTASRLRPLDAWRGLVIVVMALDHANAFVARSKLDPELWTTQYPDYAGDWAVFLTRWITHLAAPGFFFLLGVGAVLFAASRRDAGWSPVRVSAALVSRGVILILAQFALENPAWIWGEVISEDLIYFGVLWCLGSSLLIATALIRMRPSLLLLLGVGLVISTELMLPQPTDEWVTYPAPELLLLWPGLGDGIFVLYPVMPWLGVTLLGVAFGRWLSKDRPTAMRALMPFGLVLLGGFVLMRVAAGFGNIVPNQTGDAIGFLNVTKYPPSLAFLALTLGTGMVITAFFSAYLERRPDGLRTLRIFGSVPLFFYVTHLWLYATIGKLVGDEGVGIGPAFLVLWAIGLVVLYPLCVRYGRFKRSRPLASVWRYL